jgi:hypothetical protein
LKIDTFGESGSNRGFGPSLNMPGGLGFKGELRDSPQLYVGEDHASTATRRTELVPVVMMAMVIVI